MLKSIIGKSITFQYNYGDRRKGVIKILETKRNVLKLTIILTIIIVEIHIYIYVITRSMKMSPNA